MTEEPLRIVSGVIVPTWPQKTVVLRVEGRRELVVIVGDVVPDAQPPVEEPSE